MEYLRNLRDRIRPDKDDTSAIIFLPSTDDVVSYRVAIRLIEVGSKVRIGVTSDQADSPTSQELKARGVSLVPFSWKDESTYSKALQSVKAIFCVVPQCEGWVKCFYVFFDTCRKNGVKHFVKLSFYNALTSRANHPFSRVNLIKMHGDCDGKLIRSYAMDYTLLFATHLMSDPAVYQRDNIMSNHPCFYSASAGQGVNYVSPNDIAAAAMCVMVNLKDHRRVGYTLTGPTHITDDQVAELLSRDLHEKVNCFYVAPKDYGHFCCIYKDYYFASGATSITDSSTMVDSIITEEAKDEITVNTMVDQTNAEAEEVDLLAPRKQGIPSWLMNDLMQLETLKATGKEVKFMSKDFEKLCGHPAETFNEYLDTKSEMTLAELLIEDVLVG